VPGEAGTRPEITTHRRKRQQHGHQPAYRSDVNSEKKQKCHVVRFKSWVFLVNVGVWNRHVKEPLGSLLGARRRQKREGKREPRRYIQAAIGRKKKACIPGKENTAEPEREKNNARMGFILAGKKVKGD